MIDNFNFRAQNNQIIMTKLVEDIFVTKLIGFKSYIIHKKILSTTIKNIKKPFFLTIKSKKKLALRSTLKNINITLASKLIYFERNFKKKNEIFLKCRHAKKQDTYQIVKIASENNLNSRFLKDKLIPGKFKKKIQI